MNILRKAGLAVAIPVFVWSSGLAQAGVSGTALFDVQGFLIKDGAGAVLDRSTDFSLLNWTGSSDEDVFLDGATAENSVGNSTTGVDFPVICLGDCPQIAENEFPLISGAPSDNYSTADQREIDSPILNLGSFGVPAFVGNGAYSALTTGDPEVERKASANSNNGLEANFILTRDTALNFDGLLRVYAEAFVSAGELAPGKASVSHDFSLTITNLNNGIQVYTARPEVANQTVSANAGDFEFDLQLAGTHTVGAASLVPLNLLPATPVLQAGTLYQLSIRNNVNVDIARVGRVPDEPLACRLTGGGVSSSVLDSGEIIYVWDGTDVGWKEASPEGENRYQFGGQVGANTGAQPQPKGEWQHHQQKGPFGSFSFHAGTASAPAGTEIIEIRCSDPGGCSPSGNPPSPNKQLDFDCVGTFSNIGSRNSAPNWLIAGANVTAEGNGNKTFDGTFHYCQVNVDDLGEGPDPAEPDSADCPTEGFGEKGDPTIPANCDCPDFYRITIYDGVNAEDVTFLPDGSIDPATLNTTDVIYEVDGYLGRGGNGLQLHDVTGFDRAMGQ